MRVKKVKYLVTEEYLSNEHTMQYTYNVLLNCTLKTI